MMKLYLIVLSALILAGCSPDFVPPDRVFKSEGYDVEVYSTYEKVAWCRKYTRIVPPGATDIWIWWDSGFGGQDVEFRCRIKLEDLQAFAKALGYKFESFDLNDDALYKNKYYLHHSDRAIMSHFPRIELGGVLGHHSDGFLGCEANYDQRKRVDADCLKYVYDTKCGILWCTWWN